MPREEAVVNLEYEPDSLLKPPHPDRIRKVEQWLTHFWQRDALFRFPPAYVEHILQFHGGVPGKKCFRTASKRTRVIGRFFNFLEEQDLDPPSQRSWRQWSDQDIRLDYQVYCYFNYEHWAIRHDQFNVVPIAGLDMAGHNCRVMDDYDLLCFDYDGDGEPPVVAWDFESSWEKKCVKELVARSFEEFLPLLHRCNVSAALEEAKSF
jgi:hypothetical protein